MDTDLQPELPWVASTLLESLKADLLTAGADLDLIVASRQDRTPAIDDRRETPVPRWRLAREGLFLAERSPESIRSLGLVAPSEIRRTAVRTMTRLRGSLDCRCIIHGSLSGSGFHSPSAFWRWAPVGVWIICHVMGPVLPPYNCNRDVGLMQTNLDILDQYSLALQGTNRGCVWGRGRFRRKRWLRVLSVLASDVLPYRWRRWGCGGLRWIRCGSLVNFCVWTDFHVTCIIFV